MRYVRAFIVVFIVLACATTPDAATTSRLEGRVIDDQDRPLPGAKVTNSSESLIGGPQSALTDDDGSFVFHFLLVGEYTVEATLVGYTPAIAVAPVRLDRTATVTLRMTPVTFSSEIEVDAVVPIIDPTRTNTGEVFDQKYLQLTAIGIDGRSWPSNIMDQAAGVVFENGKRVFGATNSENALLIDGFNYASPSTGSIGVFYNFDATEEASVLTGGLDAEFGYGTGGVLNMVTKSGGNRFSGTFDARYRDRRYNESGEHYDPDIDVSSDRILSATLGGPILRDKLWFFVALENRYQERTPQGAPETSLWRTNLFLGKLTWAVNPANRLAITYSTTPRTADYAGTWWSVAPEGTWHYDLGYPTGLLELNSVLSDSLLLTVGLGFRRDNGSILPMINNLEVPPEYDYDTNWLFSNPNWVQIHNYDREHHRAKLSYFEGRALGSHQLDAGLEYHKLREETANFTPGGYMLYYYNYAYRGGMWPDGDGDGLGDLLLRRDYPPETARDQVTADGDGWSTFVQDQWRPTPQLTLRLGLRYDTMAHTNTVGQTIADFKKWLPRLGAAWDIGGRGRHVLRAGWSRYMHPGVTNLGMSVPGTPSGTEDYYGLDFLCGQWGICDRETAAAMIGPELVHVDSDGDEHPFYLYRVSSEIPAETVDTLGVGRLRVPYRDELILAYETRVARETSLELSFVRKDYHDQIEDTCNNNTWAWGDGEPPTFDDPSTWTVEDKCTGSVRANLDGLRRSYEALILRAATRERPWFHLAGSYTYSRTRGNNEYSSPYTGFGTGWEAFPGSDFDYFPTNFVNLDGNLNQDFGHFLKLNGYLQFPLDFTLGVGAYYRSAGALGVWASCWDMFYPSDSELAELEHLGIDHDEMLGYCQSPLSGILTLEPWGSRRGTDLWQLDLQLSKGFRIGNLRLVVIASVYNVTSEEAPTSFDENAFATEGWGTPRQWQQPRRWELGFRAEF